ncbi:MAG: hypothetical protein K0R43_392 [Pseudoduganella sp.]|jgi:hypothetical protein|nr:hypothetical protein [Pseudoduganella sp.]
MKTLSVCALVCAVNAHAECIDKIGSHSLKPPTTLEPPKLQYLGAEHSNDPAHPQFTEIERLWARASPTIAYVAGPNRPFKRDEVPLGNLEPAPQDEVKYVMRQFTPEQTTLFYTLRETARLRERHGFQSIQIGERIDQILKRFPDPPIKDSKELALAYKKYWQQPEHWWQAPQSWFDPGRPSSATGGIFTNELNAASSHFRNVHMVKLLDESTREANVSAFAVVGRNHVPAQAEALRCIWSNRPNGD